MAVGTTLQQATVAAVNLNELCTVTLELARLGANPPALGAADLAELPDLGGHFNDELVWRSLVADLGPLPKTGPPPERTSVMVDVSRSFVSAETAGLGRAGAGGRPCQGVYYQVPGAAPGSGRDRHPLRRGLQ